MENILPGLTVGFREGLEAALTITLMLKYIEKIHFTELKKNIWHGVLAAIVACLGIGIALHSLEGIINETHEFSEVWENGANILALIIVTTFIFWMIKHGKKISHYVHKEVENNLTKIGIALLAFTMIAREGVEIVLFAFAGNYTNTSIFLGVGASIIIAVLLYYSLLKVNLKILFNITLAYLIFQAGHLLGEGVHGAMEALQELSYFSSSELLDQLQYLPIAVQLIYTSGIFIYWLVFDN